MSVAIDSKMLRARNAPPKVFCRILSSFLFPCITIFSCLLSARRCLLRGVGKKRQVIKLREHEIRWAESTASEMSLRAEVCALKDEHNSVVGDAVVLRKRCEVLQRENNELGERYSTCATFSMNRQRGIYRSGWQLHAGCDKHEPSKRVAHTRIHEWS